MAPKTHVDLATTAKSAPRTRRAPKERFRSRVMLPAPAHRATAPLTPVPSVAPTRTRAAAQATMESVETLLDSLCADAGAMVAAGVMHSITPVASPADAPDNWPFSIVSSTLASATDVCDEVEVGDLQDEAGAEDEDEEVTVESQHSSIRSCSSSCNEEAPPETPGPATAGKGVMVGKPKSKGLRKGHKGGKLGKGGKHKRHVAASASAGAASSSSAAAPPLYTSGPQLFADRRVKYDKWGNPVFATSSNASRVRRTLARMQKAQRAALQAALEADDAEADAYGGGDV